MSWRNTAENDMYMASLGADLLTEETGFYTDALGGPPPILSPRRARPYFGGKVIKGRTTVTVYCFAPNKHFARITAKFLKKIKRAPKTHKNPYSVKRVGVVPMPALPPPWIIPLLPAVPFPPALIPVGAYIVKFRRR